MVRLYSELQADSAGIPLPPELEARAGEPRLLFHETDSFTGMINFLRRDIVENWQDGRLPTTSQLDHLLELAEAIDDPPGIIKARLLRRTFLGEEWSGFLPLVREVEWNYSAKVALGWKWFWRQPW